MHLINRAYHLNSEGTVKLQIENLEDLWYLYNLIEKDDYLKALTTRKVKKQRDETKVSVDTKRTVLTIRVTKVEFDNLASDLRVAGTVSEPNEYVSLGQHHTIVLKQDMQFTLKKKLWTKLSSKTLQESIDSSNNGEVIAIFLSKSTCTIQLLTTNVMQTLCTLKSSTSKSDITNEKFYKNILKSIVQKIDFKTIKSVAIAASGPEAKDFLQWLFKNASQERAQVVLENKSKFIVCKVATITGSKAIQELMENETFQRTVDHVKFSRHVNELNNLYKELNNNTGYACYGLDQVERAVNERAVKKLLITDKIICTATTELRKKYTGFIDSVANSGGETLKFSEFHVSGEELLKLTGIAAILWIPLVEGI